MLIGTHHSKETKEKISKSGKGKHLPWIQKIKNKCLYCKKEFSYYSSSDNRGKYCSHKCFGKHQIGQIRKTKLSVIGVHSWVYKNLSKPIKCEHCNKTPKPAKDGRSELHWANKSGKYLRDESDWFVLCRSCHSKYDKPWLKRTRKNGQFI